MKRWSITINGLRETIDGLRDTINGLTLLTANKACFNHKMDRKKLFGETG